MCKFRFYGAHINYTKWLMRIFCLHVYVYLLMNGSQIEYRCQRSKTNMKLSSSTKSTGVFIKSAYDEKINLLVWATQQKESPSSRVRRFIKQIPGGMKHASACAHQHQQQLGISYYANSWNACVHNARSFVWREREWMCVCYVICVCECRTRKHTYET